jgi:hypothetical protein
MFEYAVVFLLILNAISLLHLQYYCFGFRKSMPVLLEAGESKSHTLLETVDEGVQILSDLADILEVGQSAGTSPAPSGSPVMQLLTGLIMNQSNMAEDYGTQESQGSILEEDQNPSEENN